MLKMCKKICVLSRSHFSSIFFSKSLFFAKISFYHKLLSREPRAKRSLVERRERQLGQQRAGLMKLQTLHQSVESNHYIVIHHLGQQLVQVSRHD